MSIRETNFEKYNAIQYLADFERGGKNKNVPDLNGLRQLFTGAAKDGEKKLVSKIYDSAGRAFEEILEEHIQKYGGLPSLLAFGEQHHDEKKEGKIPKTTAQLFAEEIISRLPKEYEDIVVEFLPARGDLKRDREIYEEIQLEISRLDPEKDKIFSSLDEVKFKKLKFVLEITQDPQGALELILAAKKRGMNIHGGCFSFSQIIERFRRITEGNPWTAQEEISIINTNTYSAIKSLLAEGKKVVSYNGALHNDTKCSLPELVFGDDLAQDGVNYVAIDLIVPEVVNASKDSGYIDKLYAEMAQMLPKRAIRHSINDKQEVIVFAPQSAGVSSAAAKQDIDINFGPSTNSSKVRDISKRFFKEFAREFKIETDRINLIFGCGVYFGVTAKLYSKSKREFDLQIDGVCNVDDAKVNNFVEKFNKENTGFKILIEEIRINAQKEGNVKRYYVFVLIVDHDITYDIPEDYIPPKSPIPLPFEI